MASPLLLRSGENVSGDMIQRILGSQFAGIPAISGVGSGFAAGGVGRQNPTWLGTASALSGHLAVTANGTSLVLTVLPGWAVVIRDSGATSFDPRALLAELQASSTVTVASNSTGSTRNDTVCLKVDMNTAPSADGSNLVSAVILTGASGGGLANAPADGNLYLPLANIAVANGAILITTANVTDKRASMVSDYIPYGALAHQGTVQSIPTNAFTPVAFDTVEQDVNGNFSTGAAAKFVCPTPGRLRVQSVVGLNTITAAPFALAVFQNGAEVRRLFTAGLAASTNAFQYPGGGAEFRVAAGDVIDVRVFQNTGGAVNTQTGTGACWAAFSYVGP